jgi:hypothetical protein
MRHCIDDSFEGIDLSDPVQPAEPKMPKMPTHATYTNQDGWGVIDKKDSTDVLITTDDHQANDKQWERLTVLQRATKSHIDDQDWELPSLGGLYDERTYSKSYYPILIFRTHR